jgi:pimeloyl-ACP methyl ester carboxylesterase
MKTDLQIPLRDGRALGCAEFGDALGDAVFYFHGVPSSRLEAQHIDPVAAELGARLIAIDRPGYGLSDSKRNRTIVDWPRDVVEVADALGIARFAVLGVSGGGPYALACATKIPDRLTAAGIVCGVAPLDDLRRYGWTARKRAGCALFRRAPWLASLLYRAAAAPMLRRPDCALAFMAARCSGPDRQILEHADVSRGFVGMFREAIRQGTKACAMDLRLYCTPWGFDLAGISVPVFLWHGELDKTLPVSMGRHLASVIPNCRARFLPDEGHYSLPIKHMREVLGTLVRPQSG